MRLAALCELPIEELAMFCSTEKEGKIFDRYTNGEITRREAKFLLLSEFRLAGYYPQGSLWEGKLPEIVLDPGS